MPLAVARKRPGKPVSPIKEKRERISPGSSSPSTVEVYVRLRPPFTANEAAKNIISIVDNKSLVFDPKIETDEFYFHGIQQKGRDLTKKSNKNLAFEFDGVFGQESTNLEVYEATTKNILDGLLDGYNCSVFAYGATGAGKTFTMLGNPMCPGVSYHTIVEVLEKLDDIKETVEVKVACSYLEVYNENVHDLLDLSGSSKKKSLNVLEEGNRVIVPNLRVEGITSSDQLFNLLDQGNSNRTQHPTDSNAESSRSHAVFQLHVKMVTRAGGQVKVSKLSMIDLAGSERGSATGFSGARFKEGANINRSLLALGKCINALADGLKYVPYRDSKLTRILKDSLGGNCRTIMVANISPNPANYEDTYNTLKYAARAKHIKSNLSKNIISADLSILQYKDLVSSLKHQIAQIQASKECVPPCVTSYLQELNEIMSNKKDLHSQILNLKSHWKVLEYRIKNKKQLISLCEESEDQLSKMNSSLAKLEGMFVTTGDRIQELYPTCISNKETLEDFLKRAKAANVYQHLEQKYLYWIEKIDKEDTLVRLKHQERMMNLKKKREESLEATLVKMTPSFTYFYRLLRAHDHVTDSIREQYEDVAKSLDGLKQVTWKSDEEENKSSEEKIPVEGNPITLSLEDVENRLKTDIEIGKDGKTLKSSSELFSKAKAKYMKKTPLKTLNSSSVLESGTKFKKLLSTPHLADSRTKNLPALTPLNQKIPQAPSARQKLNCLVGSSSGSSPLIHNSSSPRFTAKNGQT